MKGTSIPKRVCKFVVLNGLSSIESDSKYWINSVCQGPGACESCRVDIVPPP